MRRDFTYDHEDCFWRNYEQRIHVMRFCEAAKKMEGVEFYWPNYDQAPWHIQCVMLLDGEDKAVNFWPHKNKGQIAYEKAICGLNNFMSEIGRRADEDDTFDVIE